MVSLLHFFPPGRNRSSCWVVAELVVGSPRDKQHETLVMDDTRWSLVVVSSVEIDRHFENFVVTVVAAAIAVAAAAVVGLAAALAFGFRFASHIDCQIAGSLVVVQDSAEAPLDFVGLPLLYLLWYDASLQTSLLVDQPFDAA